MGNKSNASLLCAGLAFFSALTAIFIFSHSHNSISKTEVGPSYSMGQPALPQSTDCDHKLGPSCPAITARSLVTNSGAGSPTLIAAQKSQASTASENAENVITRYEATLVAANAGDVAAQLQLAELLGHCGGLPTTDALEIHWRADIINYDLYARLHPEAKYCTPLKKHLHLANLKDSSQLWTRIAADHNSSSANAILTIWERAPLEEQAYQISIALQEGADEFALKAAYLHFGEFPERLGGLSNHAWWAASELITSDGQSFGTVRTELEQSLLPYQVAEVLALATELHSMATRRDYKRLSAAFQQASQDERNALALGNGSAH